MTTKHKHDNPILVTGAAGAVGGIGRNLTEFLLATGHKVRALVRREDERAEALRRLGAEVVAGRPDGPRLDAPRHRRLRAHLFRNVCLGGLPGSHDQHRRGGAPPRRRGFREHVADDGHADEHHRDHRQPAAQAALAGGAGSVLVGTAGRHGAADSLPRGLLSSYSPPPACGPPTSWRCRWAAARPRRSRRSTWRVR